MKIYLKLAFLLLIPYLSFAQKPSPTDFPKQNIDWHRQNVSKKVMGTDVQKAYAELLANKKPAKTIIVAVIDGGIDNEHEDLKANIWVNAKEIADNGIDDDKNGYIDDINGWNFLGNSNGENIDQANLEVLRIYRQYLPIFDASDSASNRKKDPKNYAIYLKTKKVVEEKLANSKSEIARMDSTLATINTINKLVYQITFKNNPSLAELKSFKPANKNEKQIIDIAIKFKENGLTKEAINGYKDHLYDESKFYYNLEFTPREDIVGDDINDINDRNYGNNDVKGPDAFHGTFCAGIIAAMQNNSLGIEGIANNVKIMCLRAVPNGDEYDKDVALAIRYAVDNGASIINMSFGKGFSPQKQFVDEAIKYAEMKGVLLIHAAGNDANDLDKTENYPTDSLNTGVIAKNVMTIGASSITPKKTIPTDFSNYGKTEVDLFAPGKDIVSTRTDDTYDMADGTSFAAPVTTGVAALVLSYYPNLTCFQLKEILMKSVSYQGKKKVVLPGEDPKNKIKFSELSISGGIVNAYNALKLAETYK
jgi:subtilisin family serine protease